MSHSRLSHDQAHQARIRLTVSFMSKGCLIAAHIQGSLLRKVIDVGDNDIKNHVILVCRLIPSIAFLLDFGIIVQLYNYLKLKPPSLGKSIGNVMHYAKSCACFSSNVK
jgi:hypothetical protein